MAQILENTGLNEVQISLLRMFSRKMSIEESVELRDMLFNFYSEKALNEVDKIVATKPITEIDYQNLRNQHQRTKAK
jgi:hypothetical protein